MAKTLEVPVDGGKYTVIQEDGVLRFERYGEPWMEDFDGKGSKMIIAMACELETLREYREKMLQVELTMQNARKESYN